MYHVPLALQCIYGHSDKEGENRVGMEGVRVEVLVLCGESEEDLKVIVGCTVEVYKK